MKRNFSASKDPEVDTPSRIVTRADLDGLVCALLLREAFKKKLPVLWAEPVELERDLVRIENGDVVANLPFSENCMLWFDHHPTNRRDGIFNGKFEIAPSAAGIIYKYYEDEIGDRFIEIVNETDRIDSAALNEAEVLNPSTSPYFLISLTINSSNKDDIPYWNLLTDMFQQKDIYEVLSDPAVKKRTEDELKRSSIYKEYLLNNTLMSSGVTVTDFRKFSKPPSGNRFLVFSLYPLSTVNVKIRYSPDKENVIVSVGHSIFKKECRVHCGKLVAGFGGGGHFGAGSCMFPVDGSEEKIDKIISVLRNNKMEHSEQYETKI